MTSKEMTYKYRLAQWAGLAKERGALGMSIRSYCAMKGFAENTYFYWQRRLRTAACEELGLRRAEQPNQPVPGFAEVRLSEAPVQPATAETAGTGQLHIEVAGIKITTDSTYPTEQLAALLRELPC